MVQWTARERAAWRVTAPRPVAVWAAETIRLTGKMGLAATGMYDVELTPWVKPLYAAYEDARVESITWVAAAQIGKSLSVQVLIGWVIDQDPSNILYFFDTDANAKYASMHRIQKMIDGHAALRAKVDPPRKRQKLEICYDGGVLSLCGANSVSQLGNKSAPRVMRDETSKWRDKLGIEAGALDLAEQRLKGQYRRKLVDISTPVQEGDPILKQYAQSDQGVWMAPCPRCGEYQTLRWEQMRWPKDETGRSAAPAAAREGAWYECQGCRGRIDEHEKRWMTARGRRVCSAYEAARVLGAGAGGAGPGQEDERIMVLTEGEPAEEADWRIDLPDGRRRRYRLRDGGRRSRAFGLHLSRLYSPFESWGQMVEEFLHCRDDLSALQAFVNAALVQPWKRRAETLEVEEITAHLDGTLRLGAVPAGYDLLTIGVDVQLSFLAYSVWAWREDRARALVETARVAGFEDLAGVIASRWPAAGDGEELGAAIVFIDSGYRTTEVYDFCRAHAAQCLAIKGEATNVRGQVSVSRLDKYPDGKVMPGGLRIGLVHGDTFKSEFFDWAADTRPEARRGEWPARSVRLPSDTPERFLASLGSEQRVEVKDRRGRVRQEWRVRRRELTHELDSMVYAAAAFWHIFHWWTTGRRQPPPAVGPVEAGGKIRTQY